MLHQNQILDLPHDLRQVLWNLIIPKADNSQSQLTQRLFSLRAFFLMQIMDFPIDLDNQHCLVTIKVDDKSSNDLSLALPVICLANQAGVPPKMDTQLIRPQFMPHASRSFQQESCRAEVLSHVGVFFCHSLTGADVFDGHEVILIQNPTPAYRWLRFGYASRSPKGEEPILS